MPPPAEALRDAESVLRVVISHPMRTWADALERLLAPRWDIDIVVAHTTPSWVRHAVINQQADVLLTHVSSPVGELHAYLSDLLSQNDQLGVVILSDSRDPALLTAAVRAGARGWVEPTTSLDHLVRVLRGVARGETWFPPALLTPVIDALLDERESRELNDTALSALSGRELEVLSCLAKGMTRREIAERLTLSPHTVRTHINNLLRKLDVHSTLAAVSLARQWGVSERERNS